MATISENLQTIKNSMDAIKQAIIDKGGTIEGDITTWANAISGIETGGGESTGGVQCFFIHATQSHPMTGAVMFEHTYTFLLDNVVVWGDCNGKSDINNEATISVVNLNGRVIVGFSTSESSSEFISQESLLADTVIVVGKTYEFYY